MIWAHNKVFQLLSKVNVWNFPDFLHIVAKAEEQNHFFGKILSSSFWAKIGPKMKCFKFCQKSVHGSFLIFCMKLQQHKGLKLTQMVFLGKSCTRIFKQKVAQNEFFQFYSKLIDRIFLIFLRELTAA